MKLSDELFTREFSGPRTARSGPYKVGVKDLIQYRAGEIKKMECPYIIGTVNADAYFGGVEEGRRIWAAHIDRTRHLSLVSTL
jgi:hypothetical protein